MGYVHIYCGDGKGKTTAATGLAVRAAGRHKRVLIARFLKTDDSGEVKPLSRIDEITVLPCERSFGFYFQMTDQEKEEAKIYYGQLFERAAREAVEGEYDMLVCDEIMAALSFCFVQEADLIEFLDRRPRRLEVVLTGRNPSDALVEKADYVSEIKKIKHPFDRGVIAREGIEY